MKRPTAVVLSLLLLSGCAGTPTAGVGTAEEPNKKPCAEFSNASSRFADLIIGVFSDDGLTDAESEELANVGATYDAIGLKAEGAVATRISEVTQILDDKGVTLSMSPDNYYQALESVARACKAEGFTISYGKWK